MKTKILGGAIIYSVWSILIGFFVPMLAIYSTVIAALAAGIYVGYGNKILDGLKYGALTGLIGGILCGISVNYFSTYIYDIVGIPAEVYIGSWFTSSIGTIIPSVPSSTIFYLPLAGLVFGGIGGVIGSIRLSRGILLFLTLFVLFILYGAIDNMAWNWGRPDWPWYMSFQHVLTNEIDIWVAVIFAFAVTILYYILE